MIRRGHHNQIPYKLSCCVSLRSEKDGVTREQKRCHHAQLLGVEGLVSLTCKSSPDGTGVKGRVLHLPPTPLPVVSEAPAIYKRYFSFKYHLELHVVIYFLLLQLCFLSKP